MAKLFETILQKGKVEGFDNPNSDDAMDWLREQAKKVSRANPKDIIDQAGPFKRIQELTGNSIGKMYMFSYDPKTKDKLPFYDTYPLVFPVEYYGDGFLGINLHYLPPMLRAKLMDALYDILNNKKYDKTTKLKISYDILRGAARFKYFEPCLKRYLFNHVKSPFVYISPDEWNIALMLPTERFVGASKSTVYQNSTRMVR